MDSIPCLFYMKRKGDRMEKSRVDSIREDLINQLELKGMHHSYYRDMVDQYCDYFEMKNDLMEDVKKKGVRVEVTSGNGFTTSKDNGSIMLSIKVTQTMLKILNDLGLREPVMSDVSEDDYL